MEMYRLTKKYSNQTGQVILVLLLVMTVALTIGLSVVQRSLTDVSTASKLEQSSRAFSAAEAGIEQALSAGGNSVLFQENNASADVQVQSNLPPLAAAGAQQVALEYPPISKEEVAHFWLADPFTDDLDLVYDQSNLEIYWGNIPPSSAGQMPAIEIKVVYQDNTAAGNYLSKLFFVDPVADHNNGFLVPGSTDFNNTFASGSGCSSNGYSIATVFSEQSNFYCKVILQNLKNGASKLVLVRLRLLYTVKSEHVAIRGFGTCGTACSLPSQAQIYRSVGTAGETQRVVQLFRLEKVVPFYFDYAIFSAGDIIKPPSP